jgi:hypothetical protein
VDHLIRVEPPGVVVKTVSRRTVVAVLTAGVLGLGSGVAASAAGESAAPSNADDSSASPGTLFKRTELYFGTAKPDGTEVTPEEFDRFSDKVITSAFPDGFTELTGMGQYKGASGEIVREHSFVVIVLYPVTDQQANGEIEGIRADYKRSFHQESVLRTDSVEKVSF